MILTDFYKGEKLTDSIFRFDVTQSTGLYDLFESLLVNKRAFNIGGLSFNLVERPDRWAGKKTDKAITKGSTNITSIKRPDIESNAGFGDIAGTQDGCIIIFNPDFKDIGILSIEIFISRGLRNNTNSLWNLYCDGELAHDIETLRSQAVTKNVTRKQD